jgi:hypothetical protein
MIMGTQKASVCVAINKDDKCDYSRDMLFQILLT